MIEDLDEALRQLLIREVPIKNNDIDITFDQPKREWSARLNRPTLNLFLYDMRENLKLRQTHQGWDVQRNPDGTVTQRRQPVRIDLFYIITSWATEPEDEHRLLARTLMALFRTPRLEGDWLPMSLRDQPAPISLMVAQPNEIEKPTDLWNVLDNQIRPAIGCTVTMALNPYAPVTGPTVRTRELRVGQVRAPEALQKLIEIAGAHVYWTVGGSIHTLDTIKELQVKLVERGVTVPLQDGGRFTIGNLQAGRYTLEISAEGRPSARHEITVPAPDYDIDY